MSAAAEIRILVVDDQQIIREGIASLLDIQTGVTCLSKLVRSSPWAIATL